MAEPAFASYIDLRERGEGDVARTIEVVPDHLLIDVDDDGRVLGVEKLGSEPLRSEDAWLIILALRAPENGRPDDG